MDDKTGKITPTILVHGGAWGIPDTLAEASVEGVKAAVKVGYEVLVNGGSAVDAVERAVRSLEDNPAFDAGHGSVLNSLKQVEMDAVIMEGDHLNAGAVACVQNIANPVSLARLVMDKTDHVLLVGRGANMFATEMGVPSVPMETLVTPNAVKEWEEMMAYNQTIRSCFKNRNIDEAVPVQTGHDTVGAVALDSKGNVAFATSTGGITAKRPGRVGDSPLIGSGGYCDNRVGAVSTTGHGEAIIKVCLAKHIMQYMEQGYTAQEASDKAIQYMTDRVQSSGGVITLKNNGEIGLSFSTERMAWASLQSNTLNYGLNPDEKCSEKFII
ncbi:unnamed protein product [Owenia fusiformis]|uniref:Uncharacterized protein n=1 Tax=Owenia fusiformis TaxID=6347 RepID=A0A8J1U220_OWEFU|nr:unnamed protein product [Owenia fusiformis]